MSAMEIPGFGVTPAPHERADTEIRKITLPGRHLALGLILLLAAFLNFYQISRGGFANSYYAAAVKSMSLSWHNFFFAAFDPSGFVTIDKPPLGFWFQVASVKLFGFNGVSLLLPEGIAGILSVALLYHLVKRVYGTAAGLLAALFMAITPVAVADNRNNTIDSILVLFMLLGAWAVTRAVEQRRSGGSPASGLRWLLLCAVLVGLGFTIKMLEAFLVVPAFGLVYLLGAQVRWRTRLVHLFLAAVLMLTVSLSWAVAVDLTPASQRPWVDSTTTNSELDLAIGYNGLQRLLGQSGTPGRSPGAAPGTTNRTALGTTTNTMNKVASGAHTTTTTSSPRTTTAVSRAARGQFNGGGGGGGGLFNNGAAGPLRLIDSELGGQAGWLLPLAVIALLAAGSRRFRFPLDRRQQGLVLWGAWLLTMTGFFSVAGFFHSYYLVTLAPAIAALAAIGLVTLWHEYLQHRSPTNWRGWLLPLALVVTAIAQVHILSGYPAWSRWMAPLVLAGTIIPALGLAAARFRPRRRLRLWVPFTAAMGSLALLVAPTVWAANTVSTVGGGIPSAGPSVQSGNGGGGGPGGFGGQGGFGGGPGNPPSAGPGGGGPAGQPAVGVTTGQKLSGSTAGQALGGGPAGQMPTGGGGDNASVDSQLLNYLLKHQGSTYYLVVTSNSNSAAPYIIKTGKPVMSLGGFGGNDPILTLAQFQDLVKGNKVRYVLGGGGGGGGGGQGSSSSVTHWVQTACTAVPSSSYQSTTTSNSSSAASTSGLARGFDGGSSLYDCAGA